MKREEDKGGKEGAEAQEERERERSVETMWTAIPPDDRQKERKEGPGRLKKGQRAGDRPGQCGRQFHRAVSERGENARKREASNKNHERDALLDG